ncbi:adenylate kinase 8 [Stegastes partitus]|uniref:Adenylate kinase 8 n=1 Tax=Stegastes partitus TaxID=144197 RepID=A0A9Y4N5F2_9TELE|nr:PREDICTED: adenylate kinase 8 [Stegastes partitus]
MDETVKPVRIPPQMFVYADKHNVTHLVQTLVSDLLIDQPDDPISFLIDRLQRTSVEVPRVLLFGPPAVGKTTVATRLSAELRAVHVAADQSELSSRTEQEVNKEVHTFIKGPIDAVHEVFHVLEEVLVTEEVPATPEVHSLSGSSGFRTRTSCCSHDLRCVCVCVFQGWVLVGFPRTRLQALSLQQLGVLPEHVVLLTAPDEVLLQRFQGRQVDPLTGDVYHHTFIRPVDDVVARRLEEGRGLSEEQRLAELQCFRREVTGISSAYQHVLKVVNGDQPHADVYQQVLDFVQTQRRSRTPRILLLGPPGSGKSHQARLLSHKYKMVDVCCGCLLRSVAADGSAVGQQIQPYLDDGRPVADSLVLQVLQERLSRMDCTYRGWIVHGFPWDLQQAKNLQESQHQPNRVFFLELTDDVCLERITLRATDPVSGQRFHTVTRPAPNSEVQNRLQTRPEDKTHTVAHSLKQYRNHSAALQSVYPDAVHIDADQDPHSVFEAVESKLTAN